jgi:hypothetical protein
MSRTIVTRKQGDICVGLHVRDQSLLTRAACEAVRLRKADIELKRPVYPLPDITEGEVRDASVQEYERYYKLLVWEFWTAMEPEFARARVPEPEPKKPKQKTKRDSAKSSTDETAAVD